MEGRNAQGWESGLWEALKALPLKQRQTIAYHCLVGMPYVQVAQIVVRSDGTIGQYVGGAEAKELLLTFEATP